MYVGESAVTALRRSSFPWKCYSTILSLRVNVQQQQLSGDVARFLFIKKFRLLSSYPTSYFHSYPCAAQFLITRQLSFLSLAKMAVALKSRRAVEGTTPAVDLNEKIGGHFIPSQNPDFLASRLALWKELYAKQQVIFEGKEKEPICIYLPDGNIHDGLSFQTTPMDIAQKIFSRGADKIIVAKVIYLQQNPDSELPNFAMNDEDASFVKTADKGILWDLLRPLEGSCHLFLLRFEDEEAKIVFWHSSAHILGEALELLYGAHLTVGPPLTSGFYYDSFVGNMSFNETDLVKVTMAAEDIVKQNQSFERLLCTKEEALKLFIDNPFKQQLISNKIPDGTKTTCYRCGTLIDLCRGPHIVRTGKVSAFALLKHSSAYWLGKNNLDVLQRIYGVAFPEKKQLKEFQFFIEEAKRRDHRVIGNSLNLFFFDPSSSAGSCFWLPTGARLYLKLCDFIRKEYRLRGFQEVISPNLYSCDLWKTSGHYQNYKDSMFIFNIEEKEWGLKPMNCPGHCVMFKHLSPSYRQLPLRFADFGVLHRNEYSGSLSGLTRVRRFQQDDAHIFCTMEQIEEEVLESLKFLFFVYDLFGFKYELKLSTRPEKALGGARFSMWND
ncbi:threonyl-tRna synthetase family protein [Cardiosporidium cionae]|uniref:threonine--tRNA ligase n=1 Tax=Cardiosporidium cionae TaxID=476202 RepID=A0ABQ7J431_9APIC|nr:threonyl-tRna synthetase family protein [Cardiosporidium cionae]|eukprot:KAF8817850.1 threonyl-tRna synthetase family protein [Cardiosporidium cionae]